MKHFIIFLALVLSSTTVLAADFKIGFVNTDKILEESPQAKAADRRLQSEFSKAEKDILDAEKRIKLLEEQLERNGPTMRSSKRMDLELDINRHKRNLAVMKAEFQERFVIRRNEEITELQKTVANVVADYAKQNRFDLILTDGVFYASDAVDITDKILNILKRQ